MASLSDEALVNLLSSFEKKLDLQTLMLARQQSLIDDLTSKVKKTQGQNLKAENKRLRIKLAQSKQAYDELARFMKVQ